MLTNDQTLAVLAARLDDQDEALDKILTQTQKTNGRVTKLEQDQAIGLAVKAALGQRRVTISGWLKGLIYATAGSAFGSFAYLIFHH